MLLLLALLSSLALTAALPRPPGLGGMPPNATTMLRAGGGEWDGDQAQPRPFGGACTAVALRLRGGVGATALEGRCFDGEGGMWWDTSLNLNRCVGNDGGRLVYAADGDFDDSCRPCDLVMGQEGQGVRLKCSCRDRMGVSRYTELQLAGEGRHNPLAVRPVRGKLSCGSAEGMQQPYYGT